ncbi:MAG: transglycosylase domain-containing protein [Alphaproteobacteria bacterium]
MKNIGKWMAVAAIWCGLCGMLILAWYAHDLPDISAASAARLRPTIDILADDKTVVGRYGDVYGQTVTATTLPPHVVQAVIATEDRRFFNHFGIDIIGLGRALWTNWQRGGVVQGGSTVTQQLAKNLFLSPERTMKRKIQEVLIALMLEHRYSKEQILTGYLNRVYLASGVYGFDAAAQLYFQKHATELNIWEAAVLAGMLKAPTRYSPAANPEAAAERANVVLGLMEEEHYITSQQKADAVRNAHFPKKMGNSQSTRYFTDWVIDQLPDLVGQTDEDLVVLTTMNAAMQQEATKQIQKQLAESGGKSRVEEGSLLSMTPSGEIKAMVGGKNYENSQFNRVTQALRQPGSAFKPFVYLAALEDGIGPDDMLEDSPFSIGRWHPQNYDGTYHGAVTMGYALAHSLNIPTIRLMQRVGVDRVRSMARRLGIAAPMHRDLSLALGSADVTLMELTGAYAVLANKGLESWPHGIAEIRTRTGKVLYKRSQENPERLLQPWHVAAMNGMLARVVTEGTGKAALLPISMAGKTGTSQEYRNAWFIGYTSNLVTGVWVGNDNNKPMKKITGGSLPARIWKNYMQQALHTPSMANNMSSLSTTQLAENETNNLAPNDQANGEDEIIANEETMPENDNINGQDVAEPSTDAEETSGIEGIIDRLKTE